MIRYPESFPASQSCFSTRVFPYLLKITSVFFLGASVSTSSAMTITECEPAMFVICSTPESSGSCSILYLPAGKVASPATKELDTAKVMPPESNCALAPDADKQPANNNRANSLKKSFFMLPPHIEIEREDRGSNARPCNSL